MRRALVEALMAREMDRDCYEPVLVLAPGQEPPADWDGDVIRLEFVDARRD